MAEAIGYAVLPVTLSIQGASAQLTKQLVSPAQNAAKKASDAVRKQLSSGADAAAKAVESARNREVVATRKVVDAEKSLKSARDTAEQKAKSVESAELKLQAARSTAKSKIADAEKKLSDLRSSGKASAEQLQSAERNLESVRAIQGAKVIDAENRVQSARAASIASAEKAAEAEDKLATAKSRASEASQAVIDATRKLDDAQAGAAASADNAQGAFGRLRAKMSELKDGLFGAKDGADTAGAAASKMGGDFEGAHGSSESLAGSLGGFAKKAGLAAAAFAGLSGVGSTISAGFAKVNKIEDTTASLEIMMGSASAATDVMNQLQESNQNTPYAFDAWSEAGKNLVAFGIDADKTAGIVTALGEAASASGKGEDALNSMGRAFGTAAASGKISMETINSLAEGGVNGLAILANDAGVTTAEMQKMISSGTVPAAEAIDTLTKGIMEGSDGAAGATTALTGTMESMSKTTSGRLANMKSAFTNLAGSIMGAVAPAIGDLAKIVTDAVYKVKGWVDALIDGGGALDGVRTALGFLTPILKPMAAMIGTVTAALGLMKLGMLAQAGATRIAEAATKGFKGALSALAKHPIVAALAAVVGALTWFFTSTETGRELWGKFMDALQDAWSWLKDTFEPVFSAIGDAVRTMWDGAVDAMSPIMEWFGKVGGAISEVWRILTGDEMAGGWPNLAELLGLGNAEWIFDTFQRIKDAVGGVWDVLKQIPDLAGGIWDILFNGDFTGLPFGLEEDSGVVDFLFKLRDAVMAVGGFVKDSLGGALSSLWDALKDIGPAVLDVGKALGGAFLDAAKGVWEAVKGLWDGLKNLWDALSPLLLPVLKIVGAVLGGAVLAGILAVVAGFKVFAGVVKIAAKIISWLAKSVLAPLISVIGVVARVITTVLGKAFEIFGGVVKWISGLIGDTLGTVWDGITSAWDASISFLSDLFTGLWEGLQSIWESYGQPVVDFIADAFEFLWEGIKLGGRLLGAFFEVIWLTIQHVWDAIGQPVVDFIVGAFQFWWDGIKIIFGWLQDGWEVLWGAMQTVWDTVGQPVIDFVVGAFDFWWRGMQRIFGWVRTAWDAVWSFFQSAWNTVGQPVVDAIVGVFEWFRDAIGGAFDTIKGFAEGLWNSISEWFGKIGDKVGSIKDTILDKVKGAKDWLVDTGKNIVDGLLNGIGDLGKKITDWFLDKIPGWMKEPFKKALGIHSPSRVFKGYGVNIGEGLIKGIDSMGSKVADAAEGMADQVASAEAPVITPSVDTSAMLSELEVAYRGGDAGYGALSGVLGDHGGRAAANAAATVGFASRGDVTGANANAALVGADITPMLDQQGQAVDAFGKSMSSTILDVIDPMWGQMGQGLTDVKTNLVDPAFAGLQAGLTTVGDTMARVTGTQVNPAWTQMGTTVNVVKTTLVDPAFAGVQAGVQATGQWFTNTVTGVMNPQWSSMGSHLMAVKDGSIIPTFGAVQTGLDTLSGWFSTTVTNVGVAWDRMRAATGTPARFVVETVFNNGIRSAWNAVASMIDEDELNTVPLGNLGAYATGGVLPGYTPGKDVHRFTSRTGGTLDLSGGEAIMRPEWTRAVGGPKAVNEMNAMARAGKLNHSVAYSTGGVFGHQAYANGGVLTGSEQLTTDIQRAMMNSLAQAFPNAVISSGTRYADVGSGYDNHMAGRAMDLVGPMPDIARWIYKTYPESAELIHWPLNGWQNLKNGAPLDYGAATNSGHMDHVHWAMSHMVDPYSGKVISLAGPGDGSGGAASMAAAVSSAWNAEIDKIKDYAGPGGMFGDAVPKIQDQMIDMAWSYVSDKAGTISAAAGNIAWDLGAGVEQWRSLVEKVLKVKGQDVSLTNTVLRRMNQESGGNPNAINDWDSNAAAGTPSKGLMQVIDPTFQANKDPGYDDIWDPESNIRASMNYAMRQYGSLPAAYDRAGGYALGGVLPADLRAGLYDSGGVVQTGVTEVHNESGKPEALLTNSQWSDVSGLVGELSKLVPAVQSFAPQIQAFVDDNPQIQQAVEVGTETMKSFNEKHPDVGAEVQKSMTDDALDFFGMKGAWFTDISQLGIEWEVPAEVEKATGDAASAADSAADAATSAAEAADSAAISAEAVAAATDETAIGAEATSVEEVDSVPAPAEPTVAAEPQMEKKTLDNSTVVNFVVENVQASDPQEAAREVMREARRVLAAFV
jgi:tape measure domain-containing protein